MRFILAIVLAITLSPIAWACNGAPLSGFDNTGATDVTGDIQAALNVASPLLGGNGVVALAPGKYLLQGFLHVPPATTLCGTNPGPHEPVAMSGLPRAAILLVDQDAAPAVQLLGYSSEVSDLLFHYPAQVPPSSSGPPVIYPPTIQASAPSKIRRVTITNAYEAIDIQVGRVHVEDSYLGGLFSGITIDHAQDHVQLRNIILSTWWNVAAGLPWPQSIDTWVNNGVVNGIGAAALRVHRVDSLKVSDVLVFSHRACFWAVKSPDVNQSVRFGYGAVSGLDCDSVRYGIVIAGSHSPGWLMTNLQIGSASSAVGAVYYLGMSPHGDIAFPPKLAIANLAVRGTWPSGQISSWPTGQLLYQNKLN